MNLVLSEEQNLLRESLQRWLAERHPFERRAGVLDGADGFSRAHWREFGELGWLAAGLPESAGGLGGGGVDNMVVAECLGRALWAGPWLETVVMGADLLARSTAPRAAELLSRVVEGRALLACALFEPQAPADVLDVDTTATQAAGGWRLRGRKTFVAWAASADRLLVSARLEGKAHAVFLVDPGAAGLSRRDWRSVDGQRVSELVLDDVGVEEDALVSGDADDGATALQRLFDRGAAALVAESAGIQWALHEATLAYLGTRRQFGVALSSLQALQHRMVDIYTHCEMSTSLAWVAAHAAQMTDPTERARAVSAARSRSGRAAVRVAQEAIQLHGGMGMTTELPVGHWFKRLTVINATLGDPAWHAQRFRELTEDATALA